MVKRFGVMQFINCINEAKSKRSRKNIQPQKQIGMDEHVKRAAGKVAVFIISGDYSSCRRFL